MASGAVSRVPERSHRRDNGARCGAPRQCATSPAMTTLELHEYAVCIPSMHLTRSGRQGLRLERDPELVVGQPVGDRGGRKRPGQVIALYDVTAQSTQQLPC